MDILFLLDFSPIKPDFGLLFWTSVIFILFWFMIGKFAFKPIATALKERERSIDDALKSAANARDEMAQMKAENEAILVEARAEKSKILKEAKDMGAQMVKDAEVSAKNKASKIIVDAKTEIENEKRMAIEAIRKQSGMMALDIAEQIIRKEMKGNPEQESFAQKLASEINLS